MENWPSFWQFYCAILFAWPLIYPIVFSSMLKTIKLERSFLYTITTGKCSKCKNKALISCEINNSRGSIDRIYTEINCSCRTHQNSWNHFGPEDKKIYHILIKSNPQFTRNKWVVTKDL